MSTQTFPGLPPFVIRRGLEDRRTSFAQLARNHGVAKQMFSAVANRDAPTPWVRRVIAEALGIDYLRVWGEKDPGTPRGERKAVTRSLVASNERATAPDAR